ncbi:hypothetical protein DAEQUDRAFT_722632 [Daedalea quercina L-15889]|uniref:Uncharacterized protein n=1 Tax=Daedalea quercina L-15889 TaxID=1314783 RepID=A0A165STY4_9APHY|nr:hypothetical protein DAEQUDRAFT_722632 [Daedalea quercina L-15889]
MLSETASTTSRPRPPAKTRRLPSVQFPSFPPPPYAPSLDQLVLEAASAIPEQPFSSLDPKSFLLPHDSEEWVNEKSREELSELLLKAEGLIRTRETELGLTSTIIKSLYQDNVELKAKHETLLSRLPASPVPTAPTSPVALSPNRVLSPPYPDASLPRSPDYPDVSLSMPFVRHTRRISVTPSDLTRLADQNAELLDKLEKLEAESLKADQSGKRKLRKLEREIQLLHQELEETQAKEAELEQTRLAVSLSEEEAQRRKEEREERVRVFREKAGSSVLSSDTAADLEEIRDFAPPSELRSPSSIRIPSASTVVPSPVPAQGTIEKPNLPPLDVPEPHVLPASRARPRFLSTRAPSVAESAIVSQLLYKIRELEETNAQISKDRQLTEERLRSAQWDAESIRRVYDCLDGVDNVELEVVAEDSPEESPTRLRRMASGGTIKLSSLRRSIHEDWSKLLESAEPDAFASGISGDMRSTVRSALTQKHGVSHKARKSVVGLFDGQATPDTSMESGVPFFSSPAARLPSPAVGSELGDISTWSTAATDGLVPASPALSNGLQMPFPGTVGRTLGSELGSECGDDWGAGTVNYHLRTTSLYGLAGADLSREASMSPQFVFPSLDDSGAATAPSRQEDWGSEAGPSTPPRAPALQLTIEPPTPTPDPTTPKRPASIRQKRLSQTVRSRTHRWVEGRFTPHSTSPSPSRSPEPVRRRPAASREKMRSGLDAELTVGEVFDEAARDLSQPQIRARRQIPDFLTALDADGPEADDRIKDEGGQDADTSAVQVRPDTSGVLEAEPQGRVTRFVFEAWLWLQFAIVIMVFLYAMARRGPKSVLEEADRRRTRAAGA